MVVAFALAASARAQVGHASPALTRIHDLTIDSFTSDALNTLARKYHVVIGQYGALADSETYHALKISIENGTLVQAEDGSFVGSVGVGDGSTWQNNMVAFDASGHAAARGIESGSGDCIG
jgi:hypothetical protein